MVRAFFSVRRGRTFTRLSEMRKDYAQTHDDSVFCLRLERVIRGPMLPETISIQEQFMNIFLEARQI